MAIREVRIDLGGANRLLRCDLGAWADVEDHGYPLPQLMEDLGQSGKLNFKAVLTLVWAMLGNESPRPSLTEVGHWIDGSNFADVMVHVGEALKDAFPQPDEGNGARPLKDGRGTGATPVVLEPASVSSLSSSGG